MDCIICQGSREPVGKQKVEYSHRYWVEGHLPFERRSEATLKVRDRRSPISCHQLHHIRKNQKNVNRKAVTREASTIH